VDTLARQLRQRDGDLALLVIGTFDAKEGHERID
jgi:hypothetical protein